ncbi:TetR family transcriptional regulator [Kribbella ginsengisoli]|uniref:HTH tetR-type domain-containing protein n=1 Tax=Kribbella ginsengisoli TaxID=363865 RepID=A0ABP6WU47_9ACTN
MSPQNAARPEPVDPGTPKPSASGAAAARGTARARAPKPATRTVKPAAGMVKSAPGAVGTGDAAGRARPTKAAAGKRRAPSPRAPGRRPGGPDTRGEILRAARESFAGKGFTSTSLRAVAREAGVDAALVHHYFDSKDALFVESMALPIDPRQVAAHVLDGPREELGRRIITVFLGVWESAEGQQRMKAVLRSVVSSDDVARMMREGVTELIMQPVGQALGVPDAPLRVSLVATQLIGLALTRYLIGLEPLASTEMPELIDRMAPVLQHYLTA